MKKYAKQIIIGCLLLVAIAGAPLSFVSAQVSLPAVASLAGYAISKVETPALADIALSGFAYVLSTGMSLTSYILIGAGVLLNTSLTLTLHISDFVKNIAGVYEVWRMIRDISAMLLIFFLLWAAIQMILDVQSPKLGELLKNLVVAGVLINFSFFFASVLIDASNIISLQIYKQMVPERVYSNVKVAVPFTEIGKASGQEVTMSVARQSFEQGGISDIFMSAFNLTALYGNIGQFEKANSTQIKINMVTMQAMGIGAMLVTSTIFILISVAFLFRLGILIFILAFSPVYFAAFMIPNMKSWASKGWDLFKAQLLFMPVFLLLMYMSLKMIATGNFTGAALNPQSMNFWVTMLGLFANYFFIIVLLIIPFYAAMQFGSSAMKYSSKWANSLTSWTRKNTLGRIGSAAGWAASSARGYVGTRAIGGPAAKLDKYLGGKKFGNSLLMRDLRGATTGALAKNKFGGKRSYEDYSKELKDVKKKEAEIGRANTFKDVLKLSKTPGSVLPKDIEGKDITVGSIVGKMSEKEKLALGTDKLKEPEVLRHLKKSDFDAIKKSDDFTEDDKREIFTARTDAFKKAVKDDKGDMIKDMMKSLEGGDLMDIKDQLGTTGGTTLVGYLTEKHLKEMSEKGLDTDVKKDIGNRIYHWRAAHGKNHSAFGYIKKNKEIWEISETNP